MSETPLLYLLRNGMWAGSGRVVTALAAFLVNVLLARMLDPAGYGSYFVAVNLVTLVAAAGILGLDQTAVRLVSVTLAGGDATPRLVGRILLLALGGGVLAAALFLTLRFPLLQDALRSPALLAASLFLALWILASVLQTVIAEVFRGLHDIRLATLLGGLRSAGVGQGLLLLAGLLAYRRLGISDLESVVGLAAGSSLLVAGAGAALLTLRLRAAPAPGSQPPAPSAQRILAVAWPFLVATLLVTARTNGDSLVLAALSNPAQVALYGAAIRLVALFLTPQLVLNAVLAPMIADLHSRGQTGALERTIRLAATAAALPTTLLFAALLVVGRPVLGLLFGDYYRLGFPTLALLLTGQMVSVLSGPNAVALAMTGHQRLLMAAMAVSAGWVLGVGGLLAPGYGAAGMALAYATGLVLQNLLLVTFVRRQVGPWTTVLISPRRIREAFATLSTRPSPEPGNRRLDSA